MSETQTSELQKVLSKALQDEWIAQGHSMNNKIIETIEYVTKQEADILTLSGFMFPYGLIINAGTKSENIPYSGRTGAGGTSLYIQGLQNYVKLRMNIEDDKKSLSIAFAIAQTQKFSDDWMGMPTRGSYAYTTTGKRLEWIGEAFKHEEDQIGITVRQMCFNLLSLQVDVILNKYNIELNKN
jgi:hypothetical protein